MTDHLYDCRIDGCEYSTDDHTRLPSHVSGKRGSEAHQKARESKAWRDWYPDAFGIDEPEEGGDPPSEGVEPTEGASAAPPAEEEGSDPPSEGSESNDGGSVTSSDDNGGSNPSQKGDNSRDDYEAQWSEGLEGGDASPSKGAESDDDASTTPTDDEGGSDPSPTPPNGGQQGTSKGGPRRLATLAAPLVALLLLLFRGDRDDQGDDVGAGEPTEAVDEPSSSTDQFSTIQ